MGKSAALISTVKRSSGWKRATLPQSHDDFMKSREKPSSGFRCQRQGIEPPVFEEQGGTVVVTFHAPVGPTPQVITQVTPQVITQWSSEMLNRYDLQLFEQPDV